MTGLDDLPPDQRAALSLLLRQRKTYGEVAAMLGISERAVRERARAALDGLANGAGTDTGELSPQRRADIGDYLLGQQPSVAERLRTRTYLDGSRSARTWASALASQLAPLSQTPLPEIPAGAPPPDATAPAPATHAAGGPSTVPPTPLAASAPPAPASLPGPGRSLPSSRIGGALLLAAIVAGIVVAVVLTSGGSGASHSSHHNATPAAGSSSSSSTSTSGSSPASRSTPSTTSSGPTEQARIALTPPNAASKTIGVAVILAEGSQHAFYLAAEHVPPSKGFFYGVWLYNSSTSFEALGKSPPVGSNGRMQGGALLPTNAAGFSKLIVTRETSSHPTHPGPIVLGGTVTLGH